MALLALNNYACGVALSDQVKSAVKSPTAGVGTDKLTFAGA
ncbi:hypothetical protein LCO01nite_16550 [Lapidilactobacillus concavus]|nr:hypothetical protein LCO01nite_16550 [Lapidilactobacillus concavus]